MSRRWPFLALAALTAAALGCHKSSTGPSPSTMAGTWLASVAVFHATQSSDVVDIVAAGGTATLVLNEDHTFQFTLAPPADTPLVGSGTWQSSVDVLTLNQTAPFGSQYQFDFSLSGNTLTLSGADADYDFDGDGTQEPAKLTLTLGRTGS